MNNSGSTSGNNLRIFLLSTFLLIVVISSNAQAEDGPRWMLVNPLPPPPAYAPEASPADFALIKDCRDQLERGDFSWYEAEERCKKNISSADRKINFLDWVKVFTECYDLQKKSGVRNSQSRRNCDGPIAYIKGFISDFSNPARIGCHKALKQLGVGDRASIECRFASNYRENLENEFKTCIQRTLKSASPKFFSNDRGEHPVWADNGNIFLGDYTQTVIDCNEDLAQGIAYQDSEALLHYYGIFHFHNLDRQSHFAMSNRIGGLSGISYSERNRVFYAISDSQNDPAIFGFKLNWTPQSQNTVHFESTDYNALSGAGSTWSARTDHEDIVVMKDGKFMVVSEPSQYSPSKIYNGDSWWNKDKEKENSSEPWLAIFSTSGYMEKTIPIPDAFLPKYVYKPIPKAPEPIYTADNPPPPFFGHENRQKQNSIVYDERVLESGMQVNAGFESLAVAPSQTRLFIGNERPLVQDAAGTVRIQTLHDINGDWIIGKDYRYVLDAAEGSGLVALTALSDEVLLTLERAFEEKTHLVTSKIFCVNLKTVSRGALLVKKLLLNFKSLMPELPAGFRRIENYEGMTLGPKTPSGAESLVLVSDNNFNRDQTTNFLVLTLDSNLKESCGLPSVE